MKMQPWIVRKQLFENGYNLGIITQEAYVASLESAIVADEEIMADMKQQNRKDKVAKLSKRLEIMRAELEDTKKVTS